MPIIITDQEATRKSMGKVFAELLDDLIIIDVCFIPHGSGKRRVDRMGLEEALKYEPAKNPIILYGFEDEKNLRKASDIFRKLMAMGRVGYIRCPVKLDEFKELALKVITEQVVQDDLAKEIAEAERRDRIIRTLRHDISNIAGNKQRPPDYIELCQRAKKELNFCGSNDDVLNYILNFELKNHFKSIFAGKVLEGVFCDIDGTLLVKENFINQQVLSQLQEFEREGKSITIWTGGTVEDRRDILIDYGIFYKVVSKYDFEGCSVEIAIDDNPEGLKEYGITTQKTIYA